MVERLLCKQGVGGSNPPISTSREGSSRWLERESLHRKQNGLECAANRHCRPFEVPSGRACRLKPLKKGDYNATFTAAEWTELQKAFPNGVCDYNKPAVGEQRSVPWMTYMDGPGGTPLGAPPASHAFGS